MTPIPELSRRSLTPTRSATGAGDRGARLSPGRARALRVLVAALALAVACDDAAGDAAAEEDYEAAAEAYERGEFDVAYELWKPLAEGGHTHAQARMGVLYFNGEGVGSDAAEAVSYWSEAAAAGSLEAKIGLGNAYVRGRGVERDASEAVRWWRLAGERGHIDAQVGLGNAYVNGDGVERDFAAAELWWERAAEQGSDWARFELANLHLEDPDGFDGDDARGMELLEEAAENGHPDALYALAVFTQVGRGVEPDPERARELFEAAAEGGHEAAARRVEELGDEDPEPPREPRRERP